MERKHILLAAILTGILLPACQLNAEVNCPNQLRLKRTSMRLRKVHECCG